MKTPTLRLLAALALAAALIWQYWPAVEATSLRASLSRRETDSLNDVRKTVFEPFKPTKSFREQAEAAEDEKWLSIQGRAERLHEVLMAWAQVDLAAATGWILESEPGQERDDWLSTLLQSLAETQPRLALDHGLALNESHPDDVVPPATLLQIALQHLTAEEAIRVMEAPKRSDFTHTQPFAMHPQMDLKKLGDYIIEKSHLPYDSPDRPSVMPSNLTSVWTQSDPAGAYAFAVAMNDVIEGAMMGTELISYASEYMLYAPRQEAVRVAKELMDTQELRVSGNEMVYHFICQGAYARSVIAEVLQSVPVQERDAMAEYPLVRAIDDTARDAAARRMSALQAFGTPEGRLSTVQKFASFFEKAWPDLRKDLAALGHSEAEIAAALQ